MLTIGLDADDTLWENEAFFHLTGVVAELSPRRIHLVNPCG